MNITLTLPNFEFAARQLTDKSFRKLAIRLNLAGPFCLKGVCSHFKANGFKELAVSEGENGEFVYKLVK